MAYLLLSCLSAFLLVSQSFAYHNDYFILAQSQKESVVVSSLLLFEDETSSSYTIGPGETVTLNGNIRSLVLQDMKVSVDVESNGTEGRDWVVVSKMPSDAFALPAAESVPYEFVVRILSPGTFSVQLDAKILEIPNRAVPIDASSPDCSGCRITATIVTVIAPMYLSTSIVMAVGIVIAAGGAISIWYFRRRSKQKSIS